MKPIAGEAIGKSAPKLAIMQFDFGGLGAVAASVANRPIN
jgi:hypothetical protein